MTNPMLPPMTSALLARRERLALCDLALALGEDAPTLCGDWTAKDLVVHLLIREYDPVAAAGLVVRPLGRVTELQMARKVRKDFGVLVEQLRRRGLTVYSLPPVDRVLNTLEYFVHHEDLRRAQPGWEPRELDPRGRGRDLVVAQGRRPRPGAAGGGAGEDPAHRRRPDRRRCAAAATRWCSRASRPSWRSTSSAGRPRRAGSRPTAPPSASPGCGRRPRDLASRSGCCLRRISGRGDRSRPAPASRRRSAGCRSGRPSPRGPRRRPRRPPGRSARCGRRHRRR